MRIQLSDHFTYKRLLRFVYPSILMMIFTSIYGVVDGLFVSNFAGKIPFAAVNLVMPVLTIMATLGFMIGTGGSAVVGITLGERDRDRANRYFSMFIYTLIGGGIIVTVICELLLTQLVGLLGADAAMAPYCILYCRITMISIPMFMLQVAFQTFFNTAEKPKLGLFITVAAGLTNMVMDGILVGIFHWGVAGVAIATVLAQVLNMALLTLKLLRTKEDYRLSLRELKLKGVYLRNMLSLGIPSGLQSSMYAVSNMIIQVGVNSLGTVVVASWAMSGKTDGIFWAVSNALGSAITSFIGQNLGAGRRDRVKLCVKEGLILSGIITVSLSGLIMLLGKPLLHVLTDDQAVVDTTYEIMTYFVPFYFTWTAIEVLSAVLRGAGDAVRPVVIIGLGICLLRILWVLTLFQWVHTLFVLSMCYVTSWVVTDIAMIIYYRRGGWLQRGKMLLEH